jgi:hypothetical protein
MITSLIKTLKALFANSAQPPAFPDIGSPIASAMVFYPVSFVVVINDAPESVEEIREIADEAESKQQLPKELIEKLRRCNARLDVSSANSPVKMTDKRIVVEAKTDLDPTNPPVLKILHSLEDSTHGLTFDCVKGGWLTR